MNLMLLLISMIELVAIIILIIMLIKKREKKFNIENYSYIILALCREVLREIDLEDVNGDDLAEEVKNRFIVEITNEGIKIDDKLDELLIKDFVKNTIFINNLIAEVHDEEEEQKDEIDKIDEAIKPTYQPLGTVSTIDAINNFYTDV